MGVPGAPREPMSEIRAVDDRYVEITRRLSVMNVSGACAITTLSLACLWGQWRLFAMVLGVQIGVIAFNIWVNNVYLPRRGRPAEVLRTIVNLNTSLLMSHIARWPTPVWLWLPFIALAFDHLDTRVATRILVGFCVAFDLLAFYDGVPWIFPVSFTALAFFCSEISRRRFEVIRDMLGRSDQQRTDLREAHASIHQAHADLTAEVRARERAELDLRQAHKLEAVGRLAAGVAHEINTPVQFIGDSMNFIRDALGDLTPLIRRYQGLRQAAEKELSLRQISEEIARNEEDADLEYALENVPQALERSLDGLKRVATIVRSLKEFAHPDHKDMAPIDLNQAIESTLVICKHEYKLVADIETDFQPLPPVTCHPGEINQVILNIVVNAAHAIEETVGATGARGVIRVRTMRGGDDVVISIADTGSGIAPEIRDRIFEPFFTTKEVGKGTGQGLAVARSLIENHGGKLTFTSSPGQGTMFIVRLPFGREAGGFPVGDRPAIQDRPGL
jgi:signal transduction histidine kinase